LITLDGVKIQATRLAWFYVHGRWPGGDIIPVNGNLDDARINNLRDRLRVVAARERGAIATNTSGFRGVSKSAYPGRWQARLTWNGRQIGLGTKFETPDEASEVYEEASRRLVSVATEDDLKGALEELNIWRRQRTAWRGVERTHPGHGWTSFEHFCETIKEFPEKRWAMVPVDVLRVIGPDNFRWALPIDAKHSTRDGRAAYRKANHEANKEFDRDRQIQRDYGIDAAIYAQMLRDQRGVCACCGEPETKIQDGAVRQLSVDHDHKTGAVRGLLCSNCNQGLGYFCDDVAVLQKAIGYLRKHRGDVKFEPSVIGGALGTGT